MDPSWRSSRHALSYRGVERYLGRPYPDEKQLYQHQSVFTGVRTAFLWLPGSASAYHVQSLEADIESDTSREPVIDTRTDYQLVGIF